MSQVEGEPSPQQAEEAESADSATSALCESSPSDDSSSGDSLAAAIASAAETSGSSQPPTRASVPPRIPRPSDPPAGAKRQPSIPPESHEPSVEEEDSAALVPIQVMRVIAIGRDDSYHDTLGSAPELEIAEEEIEESEADELAEALTAAALEAPRPDLTPLDEVEVEVAESADEEEVEPLDASELTIELPKPPPPKPRAKSAPPRRKPGSQLPQPPAMRRRPWWENLFGDDFARAYRPLTEKQVRTQVDFIEKSLGLNPGQVVLDLCCGQGQQAVELAARGYGVVGYDLSVFQLALAAENAQARQLKINFLQGDAREMAFDEMFDAVLCWDTSFGYFEEEKNFNVAERMFKALRPGGVLLLDVLNRDYAAVDSPNHVWFEGDGCICMDDVSVDWITSRLKVKRSLILDDGRSREVVYSLRLYSLHELGKLLHDVGFRVTQASGDLTMPGVFLGPCSPRIIIRAQKPSNQ